MGKSRNVRYQGTTIEFSSISPALFFGFAHQDNFYMAVPEKATLDTLYYQSTIPAHDELETDEIDRDLLAKMAGKYPSSVYARGAQHGIIL